jgi:hypothetical protein
VQERKSLIFIPHNPSKRYQQLIGKFTLVALYCSSKDQRRPPFTTPSTNLGVHQPILLFRSSSTFSTLSVIEIVQYEDHYGTYAYWRKRGLHVHIQARRNQELGVVKWVA